MKSVFFADTNGSLDRRATSTLSGELARVSPLLTPSPLFKTPEFHKPKLLVNSLGHKTTVPMKAQLRAAAAHERWELDAERRALCLLEQREDTLW